MYKSANITYAIAAVIASQLY